MKLSQFNFKLPQEKIAKYPAPHRDECRMMVLHRSTGDIEHKMFKNVLDSFDEHDLFVFNDTKVFPARLYGNKEKTGARIEVFLLRELNRELRLWDVLVDPARKIRIGNKLYFGEDNSIVAEVIDNTTSRGRTLRFLYDCPHDEFKRELFALGEAPLPRYIVDARTAILHEDMEKHPEKYVNMKDENGNPIPSPSKDDFSHASAEDMEYFQCIYAKNEGAVTAPATGLHFSRELMKRMEIKGINCAYITLHCGLGNFNDIEVEDLTKHKMDSEQMFVRKDACDAVNKAKQEGKHVCAIGTSVVKATETAVGTDGLLKEYEGWTNKFIFPPYEFGLADTMVANFYHPKSTLLMATAAFGGYDNVMKCYELAVANGYKFGCFGDSLLIVND